MRPSGSQTPAQYLAQFGFVAGQHFTGEREAAALATQVQRELCRREFLNDEGFYFFEVYCGSSCRPGCRGWDGSSPRCECGMHHVPALRFVEDFPDGGVETPRCRCCRECSHVGSNTCSHCQRWLCDSCLRTHAKEDRDE